MKNSKKYLAILGLLLMLPAAASAEITVKDSISPEFIHNQGYSDEVSRLIQVKTKDPATPIPAEKKSVWKRWGQGLLKTVDPTWDTGTEFPSHNTRFDGSHIDDL